VDGVWDRKFESIKGTGIMLSEECNLAGRDVVAVYTVGSYAVIVNAARCLVEG